MNYKVLLFDLDETLLRSDKSISSRTLTALQNCRSKGVLIGISTSRGRSNSLDFISELDPDILIVSGGALVEYQGECIFSAEYTTQETAALIARARELCGSCEITIDTADKHYWNYKTDPLSADATWGETIYCDFTTPLDGALKISIEITDPALAAALAAEFSDSDCAKFSGSSWYKFTKKTATKENAIRILCEHCGISADEFIAFGDDIPDIGMLRLCGLGVAMGNAVAEVKAAADIVIGSSNEDGIAEYLEKAFLQ